MTTFLNRNPYRRARRTSIFAGFDPVLTAAVGLLLITGTLLVYAATRDWYAANGLDPQYYLKRHVINIVIGMSLAWGTTMIDYRLLRAYTPYIWGLGVFLLILVLIPGIGTEINGTNAWIPLPGGFQIQPAEIAKISIIIGISMLLSERTHNSDEPSNRDVLKALAIAALPILLILLQPDMGTVFIISASVVTIIAVSGAPTRWVVGLLLLAVLGGLVATKSGVNSEYRGTPSPAVRVAIKKCSHRCAFTFDFTFVCGDGVAGACCPVVPGARIEGFGFVAGDIRGNFVGGIPSGKTCNSGLTFPPCTPKMVSKIFRTPSPDVPAPKPPWLTIMTAT